MASETGLPLTSNVLLTACKQGRACRCGASGACGRVYGRTAGRYAGVSYMLGQQHTFHQKIAKNLVIIRYTTIEMRVNSNVGY